ncbi:type IV pilin-like G/H family protein [Microcoleus sp. BROC3]|uniref:type IV pilin-like G/H family protein n=1 Tax=Microcoleus sp. BROC3 TaxID=3055323 RepID=UPI002FD18C20
MRQQNSKLATFLIKNVGNLCVWMVIGYFGWGIVTTFMSRVRYVREGMAQEYVRSYNKRQEAHFAKESAFTTSLKPLKVDINVDPKNYTYSFLVTKQATFNYAISKQKNYRSFVGGVFVIPATKVKPKTSKSKIMTTSIVCKNDAVGTIKPPEPTYQNGNIACATGTYSR